jgi:transposase-like protein
MNPQAQPPSLLTDTVLPPPDTKRWSPARKAAVVAATRSGLISRAEALVRYGLSDEELTAWEHAFDENGIPGLRTTRLQCYRSARAAARPTRTAPKRTLASTLDR